MTSEPKLIDRFEGDYSFLSNFYASPIILQGKTYATAEHAYQAAKTLDPDEQEEIRAAPTPDEAKRLAAEVTLRPGWAELRLAVMAQVLRAKFEQSPELREALLGTHDAILVEGNTWGDFFWGICDGRGENHLGNLLMELRARLRRESAEPEREEEEDDGLCRLELEE
jgi:ribA/ribD-fused uncharacterized protein